MGLFGRKNKKPTQDVLKVNTALQVGMLLARDYAVSGELSQDDSRAMAAAALALKEHIEQHVLRDGGLSREEAAEYFRRDLATVDDAALKGQGIALLGNFAPSELTVSCAMWALTYTLQGNSPIEEPDYTDLLDWGATSLMAALFASAADLDPHEKRTAEITAQSTHEAFLEAANQLGMSPDEGARTLAHYIREEETIREHMKAWATELLSGVFQEEDPRLARKFEGFARAYDLKGEV